MMGKTEQKGASAVAYYIDLFSPETYRAFSDSARDVSGFRERQRATAAGMRPGDRLICYMTRLSRWVGVLEVTSDYFVDDTPIFLEVNDPFTVRFHVAVRAWLAPEHGVPIRSDESWAHLSFTRDLPRDGGAWTGKVRSSLTRLSDEDGAYLDALLCARSSQPRCYPLTEDDVRKLRTSTVNSGAGQIAVSLPDETRTETAHGAGGTEHVRMQAALAAIGETMGFRIWLPSTDRRRVLEHWTPTDERTLLARLPLNFDAVTMRIVANIDVLWIRRSGVVRAFEVEHTSAIYSGILRMADLMSLQPNLTIRAHIVAPSARRQQVLRELTRPVFALMESGPMSETCSYLSYDAVRELSRERNLAHMNDSVLEDYAEYAQDTDF